jgi:hypothetical protein
MTYEDELTEREKELLHAVQMAYRKHWLDDDSIGWEELGKILNNAICNAIGDDGYKEWVEGLGL